VALLRLAEGALGALIVVVVLRDVFQAVVTPRPTSGRWRLSRSALVGIWRPYRWLAERLPRAREGMLGSYGPLSVLVALVAWLAALVLGYALLLHSMGDHVRPPLQTYTSAIYFAATSLLTIGFGDFVATSGPTRLITLAAGATGLGVFAVAITFLFSLFSAFQRREMMVVTLEASAGAPPSGVTFLESFALTGLLGDVPGIFQRWQQWSAEVLDSHLAFPVLAFFRSSHDNDSWVGSLGAVMDAATLVLTTIDQAETPGAPSTLYGWAKLSRSVGGHCIEDLVQYFNLEDDHEVGVELEEFHQARERLSRAGYALRPETPAWQGFRRLRAEYAGRVNALARYWASPPAQWIGDRSPLRVHGRHEDQDVHAARALFRR
jgi:hypothetical protein